MVIAYLPIMWSQNCLVCGSKSSCLQVATSNGGNVFDQQSHNNPDFSNKKPISDVPNNQPVEDSEFPDYWQDNTPISEESFPQDSNNNQSMNSDFEVTTQQQEHQENGKAKIGTEEDFMSIFRNANKKGKFS